MRLLPLLLLLACAPDGDGDGYVKADDCDDANDAVHPDADELCNEVDDDCDGTTDEPDAIDALAFWVDFDQDGFGDPDGVAKACAQPFGWADNDDDCDDDDGDVNPDATEVPGNSADDDCDPGTSD